MSGRARWRIDWPCVAAWGATLLVGYGFWAAVVWGIVRGAGL